MDAQDGYVRGVHTAPVNQSEMLHFEAAFEGAHIEVNRVYADKGSVSNANRQFLRKHKIKSAIMHRAYKNKPALGTAKVNAQVMQKSICMNLKKQPTKFSWTSHQGESSVQMLHKGKNSL
ncbi:hypothetical protein [Nitrosomonas supralitoralis]|uniref:hypothetical protein n=1 Tax=Nitrosomonas supralitoralis TaxID=2116706 RepID=UPI001F5B2DC0|nr:hypothetical protein [Nitrosomonas supralitoralis]